MVIQKFNKLIRNRWVWGVFAVAISAFFAFDFLIADIGRDSRETVSGGAGTLGGEPVKGDAFLAVADDIRGIGQNRDWKKPANEINQLAWETLATLAVAKKNGIEATDAEVREAIRRDPSFAVNGQFSFALYERLLRENKMTPEHFEAFLKRRLTLGRIAQSMLDTAAWVSPMEVNQAVADMTDSFTVRVASFKQTKDDASQVTIDDAGIRKWYEANTNSLALPERIKLRMVKFDATDEKTLAKMVVTEDEMKDQYDATVDKYTSTDTNGVETVKKFEEVKGEIEKDLRLIAAVQYFETNLNQRAYAGKAEPGVSRLDTIAKEEGLKVSTSDWFSLEGGYAEGFMKPASSICPGANGFAEAVAELDPTSEDLRYAVIASDKAVWLIEKAKTNAAHVPTFEEAKDAIRPRALKAAQADAFKASVEAIAAKGTNAVCATDNVTTNITFAICDIRGQLFDNQGAVIGATRKLAAGGISEFTQTGPDSGILVVCVDRKPGDAAQATILSSQAREGVAQLQRGALPEAWQKWNLERLGFQTTDLSSVSAVVEEE